MIGRLGATALLSVVLAGCGGTEVQGFVREEGTGQPLPGAVVEIDDETVRADESGYYSVEIDPDQPARLEVEAPGYEPKQVMVDVNGDLETIISDVELQKESPELQQRRQELEQVEQQLEEADERLDEAERELHRQKHGR